MMHPVWLKTASMGVEVFVLSAARNLAAYDDYCRYMRGRITTEVISC